MELTNVVASGEGELLQELHQVTVEEPLTKLEPLTVRVTAVAMPAVVPAGAIDVSAGPPTVKVCGLLAVTLPVCTETT